MKKAIKTIFIFIIEPLVIFGGIPIYLGFVCGKPLLGIVAAILTITGIYGYFGLGGYLGAYYVLKNPPSVGKTHVELKQGNFVLWKSPQIEFNPPRIKEENNAEELNLTNLASEIPKNKPPFGLPTKKREDWVKWKNTYSIIKPMMIEGKSWQKIIAFLEENRPDLPSTRETLSKIEKAGNKGLLDTWPPNLQN
jgi:hypothetical protein